LAGAHGKTASSVLVENYFSQLTKNEVGQQFFGF